MARDRTKTKLDLAPHQVVLRPLVTEKGFNKAERINAYAFEVHPKANKVQIRDAVQQIYGVKVVDVRTANVKGKPRRRGRHIGHTKDWKKAYVELHEEHHIDLF